MVTSSLGPTTTPKGSPPAMATELTYDESKSGVLTASGLTLTFNGPPSHTTRRLSSVVLSSVSAVRPTAIVYRSSIAPNRRIGASRAADSDTLINDGEVLNTGEPLIVVFSGGTVGATVVANVFGTDTRA